MEIPIDQKIVESLEQLKVFLATAPSTFGPTDQIKRFTMANGDSISCVLWKGIFHITGTDIVKIMLFRFAGLGRQVLNVKKFEEGVFSDLRNLKSGTDATLEEPRSEFLEFLFKNGCIRTQKKQKVFFWYYVPHDRLLLDALERDLKRETSLLSINTVMASMGMYGAGRSPIFGSAMPMAAPAQMLNYSMKATPINSPKMPLSSPLYHQSVPSVHYSPSIPHPPNAAALQQTTPAETAEIPFASPSQAKKTLDDSLNKNFLPIRMDQDMSSVQTPTDHFDLGLMDADFAQAVANAANIPTIEFLDIPLFDLSDMNCDEAVGLQMPDDFVQVESESKDSRNSPQSLKQSKDFDEMVFIDPGLIISNALMPNTKFE